MNIFVTQKAKAPEMSILSEALSVSIYKCSVSDIYICD